jgi:hypothetical protein
MNFEDKGSLSPKESLSRGISLFREIPLTRSCRDADISEHYCPCYSSKSISTDDSRVVDSVGALLIKINDILNDVQTSMHADWFPYLLIRFISPRIFIWSLSVYSTVLSNTAFPGLV